ncbi:MAG: RluA family pseudouridine synthase [Melioribacteraceae bacterium]|nr:RluA family pseudouridine synthase [Melioribacteraceae bacterium]
MVEQIDINQINSLYEDDNLIAVNKPEGIASISENDISTQTVHSLLEKKYSQKIFIVHRIDKEVSGILLFAKNSSCHKYLNDLFAKRLIKKNYTAVVHGIVKDNSGRIDKPIREFGSGRMGVDVINGKRSITDYRVIKRFKGYTLLDVSIITGRRHQIRVHLYSIDHPVVGDIRYGDKHAREKYPRLMLRASRIEFKLRGEKNILIESPLPESFLKFQNELQPVGSTYHQ